MSDTRSTSPARTIVSTLFVAAWPALMFAVAGDVRWTEGWLFATWLVGLYLTVTIWMHAKDPALLAERRRPAADSAGADAARADRPLVLLIFLGFAVWIGLMPLDARRYHWSPAFPVAVKALGGGLLMLAAFFLFRAAYDNTYLSGVVRVQSDRKQRVVSTGVYAIVRHPMYLGMTLMFVGAPLLLGSRTALIVAAGILLVLATRITREERLLATELDGYEDYCRKVRFRLIPLLW